MNRTPKKSITVPIKIVRGEAWGDLAALALSHEFVGEKHRMVEERYSFAGGHRVRLISLKKNVHWRIPVGQDFEI